MIRRFFMFLLICGGLGFFLQREQARGTFDDWERLVLERFQRFQGPVAPVPPVVLVELRRGDLPFESWPPAPLDYALIFESLIRRQPRAVAVQSLLAWPGVESLDAATLAERIALLPRGVLACTLQAGLAAGMDPEGGGGVWAGLAPVSAEGVDVSKIPEFAAAGQMPIDELRGGKAVGFTRIELGEGVVRRGSALTIPLVARRDGQIVTSFVVQALAGWFNVAPAEVSLSPSHHLSVGTSLKIPVDAGGRLALSTRLAPPLRRVDAGVLLLDLDRDAKLLAGRTEEMDALRAVEGALVVLGEAGENTPRFQVGGAAAGEWTEAEVMARALSASLAGMHLREPSLLWQWGGWAGLIALGSLLLLSPRRWLPVFAVGGMLALGLGLLLVFVHDQWWVAPVPPLALWATASVLAALLPAGKSSRPSVGQGSVSALSPSVDDVAQETQAQETMALLLAEDVTSDPVRSPSASPASFPEADTPIITPPTPLSPAVNQSEKAADEATDEATDEVKDGDSIVLPPSEVEAVVEAVVGAGSLDTSGPGAGEAVSSKLTAEEERRRVYALQHKASSRGGKRFRHSRKR